LKAIVCHLYLTVFLKHVLGEGAWKPVRFQGIFSNCNA